ncbi:phospholipase A2 inhibitor and Ly6/PLAUR domain-containing protein-like [Sceloporus undulatus]|uniref:phospholipase A2 inhibitor and Ly6/PLAUR domain-containing protein-like n=1 Tax=Sceloporus undulatus TaxID=8520 RepID=UPI001C4D09BB|nr:phospholipase A2 inhibitor and Ly6/PLAUR domain-containing protein-like [Sceloporus undulatus]XP_042295263.1 phospholipase A2 inhibitor and Ly6/PLAUR domain-containing protein-like [Sceloporus undulatus]
MHLLALYWLTTGLLLFLANKGVSLKCEICRSTDYDCNGTVHNCLSFLDTCIIVQSERMLASKKTDAYSHIKKHAVIKRCTQAHTCNENITFVNVGDGGIIVTRLSCCKDEKCMKPVLPLPPVNTTFNGKQCPVCFSFWSTKCKPKSMVECVGDQDYCLVISGTGNTGSPGIVQHNGPKMVTSNISIQGCANKAFCDTFDEGIVQLATITIAGGGTCELARDMLDSAPGLFGPFLPVLAGLLLVKIIV